MLPESFKKTVNNFKEEMSLFNVIFFLIALEKRMGRVGQIWCWKSKNEKEIIQENNAKGLSYDSKEGEVESWKLISDSGP